MSKAVKKKVRRLKRTVRKTLGTLFLVSAIVIAAIPVDGLQAADENEGITTYAAGNASVVEETAQGQSRPWIPQMKADTQIYTSADRLLRFAYLTDRDGVQGAVIVGYSAGNLSGNSLDFTQPVDAYGQYRDNNASERNLVAVGKSDNFLFYRVPVTTTLRVMNDGSGATEPAEYNVVLDDANKSYYEKISEANILDETTNAIIGRAITVKVESGEFFPCYLEDYETWHDIEGNVGQNLYYDTVTSNNGTDPSLAAFKKADTQTYQRLTRIPITYISNQYTKTDEQSGKWIPEVNGLTSGATDEQKLMGVFAGNENIINLKVSENLKGIGDYAFYNTGLEKIELSNGLTYIGTGAFENCLSLKEASMDVSCNLSILGARAFKNCQSLEKFILPRAVEKIGDSAFENCIAMYDIDLCSGGGTNHLKTLGRDVFRDCVSLRSLTFPNNCDQDVYMSCFRGCRSLEWICARNSNIQFQEEPNSFSFEDFKAQVTDEFYFEGIGIYPPTWEYVDDPSKWPDSKVHYVAWQNNIAFSYLGYRSTADDGVEYFKQNHYELTVGEKDATGQEVGKNTFVVNNLNELEKYIPWGKVTSLTIPSKIGKQSVETIKAGVLENMCNLQKVSIPQTVTTIQANAFRGCHSLEFVFFSSENIQIAPGAFNTQDFSGSEEEHRCDKKTVETDETDNNSPVCKLHFVGPISPTSGSYKYAMSDNGKYSTSSQKTSYIIYCSGLTKKADGYTQNLEIVYNPDTGMSELVDFPSLSELKEPVKYVPSDYAYIDSNYVTAAVSAAGKYPNGSMTDDERWIIDSALNIVIPDGVESIKPGLFKEKETKNENAPVTVTAYSLRTIEREVVDSDGKIIKGTFAGCENLTGVSLLEGSEGKETVIEDYAFLNCKSLKDVTMAPTVTSMGIAPFLGCENMSDINFQNSKHFSCVNSIIYGLDGEGNRTTLIECLEKRTLKEIPETELTGITALQKEAFRGSNVRAINLRGTSITNIPEGTFAETAELTTVYLPSSLRRIENYAFAGSNADTFYVYGTDTNATSFAFAGIDEASPYDKAGLTTPANEVTWYCILDTTSYDTGLYAGFHSEELPVPTEYKVNFEYYNTEGEYTYKNSVQAVINEYEVVYPEDVAEQITDEDGIIKFFDGWDLRKNEEARTWTYVAKYRTITWTITAVDSRDRGSTVLGSVNVVNGYSALKALDTLLKGKVPEDVYNSFAGWSCSGNLDEVTEDLFAIATYVAAGEYVIRYHVMVNSYGNYELYKIITVKGGEDAQDITPPKGPQYEIPGYTFIGWKDLPTSVDKGWDIYADYQPSSGSNNPGDDNPGGNNPGDDNPGGNNPGGDNPGGNNPGGDNPNGGTGSGNNAGTHYTLTVQGGSGSGSYVAGTQVIISANAPARGQEFSSWTVSPAATVTTDKAQSSMIITMPDNDVAVIANYKASSSNGSGGTGTGSGNSNRPSGNAGTSGGTTVVIDKNGLSNTGVVSATVNGSSDSFVIKVTESASATEAVLKALQAEYGENLVNVKYFPMDISLYDSTGTRKITDTTGLSVSITLPLPDSLIAYAGNNKVAGVVNDRLDKLSPKFTTINNVACVTFTAEHFSPYVIYVDVTQLSDGTISDKTPQTGDWIHPKWFLSIGLACLSFIMFAMKDNRKAPKRKKRVMA